MIMFISYWPTVYDILMCVHEDDEKGLNTSIILYFGVYLHIYKGPPTALSHMWWGKDLHIDWSTFSQ